MKLILVAILCALCGSFARAAEKPNITATLEAWNKELIAPVFPGSSVKNEDWGPGGANQKKPVKD